MSYMDSASTKTGFGVVAKNILSYLYNTGQYDIHQLSINYPPRFSKVSEIPWTQIPAKSLDPEEPYGKALFLRSVAEGDYDIVWIMNDTYVVYDIVKDLEHIFSRRRDAGKKVPKVVYYYPVDCHVHKKASTMIEFADVPVCYNDYGRTETLKVLPNINSKLRQIPHGVDTSVFYPMSYEQQQEMKTKFLGPSRVDKFLFLNVNRNSHRKQLARCIYAFSEFKKQVPQSVLLLHTQPVDGTNSGGVIDLRVVVEELGLSFEEDVLFPKNYEPSRAYPEELMNQLYNAADCFITTDLGEGCGLGGLESIAAGTPVIAPMNTSRPEIFGEFGERGYLYDMKDYLYIDNSGLRPFGYTEDVITEMFRVFRAGRKDKNEKVQRARQWAEEHDWKYICPQWDELFQNILTKKDDNVLCVDNIQVERL
jgi:glycosyltransferase involved in cell wall biosynthesis